MLILFDKAEADLNHGVVMGFRLAKVQNIARALSLQN